jgi:hypothetical protein
MTRLRQLTILAAMMTFAVSGFAQNTIGIFTSRYDNARSGQNREEPILKPSNVNATSFGKVYSYAVDGQIYAQPLWVYGVKVPGKGTHNAVYVTTQMDSVFAFDAGGTTTTPLWQDSFIDLANGIGPVPCGTDGNSDISCGVYPYYGITGTPVIDSSTNTMYLVARTYNYETKTAYQTLHALDITTGAEKFGGPEQISGSVPGNGVGSQHGMITFNPLADIQRAGLLLVTYPGPPVTKTIFIGWAGAAHGWIMAYDASQLTQDAILATTPNAGIGGIWASGNGLAADSAGNVYAAVGDALFDANSGGTDYGDTLMKLDSSLSVQDYFTPMDQACRQQNDMDLGSSGPMVLPTQGGAHPSEVLQSGKGGNPCDSSGVASLYVVDRTNMGKYNANLDNIVQEVSGAPGGYWSSPAYWSSNGRQAIYYGGVTADGGHGDYLKMYALTNGLLSTAPVAKSSNIFPIGTTPTVSSNGNNNGIVWAIERKDAFGVAPGDQPAVLYAYNAVNLATLYASNANPLRDQGGCANKFQVPTVANGKVFVATQNELDVFAAVGTPPAVSVALGDPCYTYAKQQVGTSSPAQTQTITNTGTSPLTLSIAVGGLDPGDFTQTNNCPSSLSAGQSCTVQITFTPTATGARVASLLITDNAPTSPQNSQLMGVGD